MRLRSSSVGAAAATQVPPLIDGPRATRLQEVNVTVMTLDLCQSYYKSRIRTRMFCAGQEAGGVDACQVTRTHAHGRALER